MDQAARPGKDRGHGVGRGLLALLPLAIMARYRAVRGFRFHNLSIWRQQHACHQAKRTEALRHGVGLHVAVIVLAGPDELAAPFQR